MIRAVGVVTLSVLLSAAAGYVYLVEAQSQENEAPFNSDNAGRVRLMQFVDPDIQLDSCQQDCRERYGLDVLDLHRGGGDMRGRYHLYTGCLENCNCRFWTPFDKETGDTHKNPSLRSAARSDARVFDQFFQLIGLIPECDAFNEPHVIVHRV